MLPLRLFRSTAPGLADLLNWAALIADGVIIGKDGSVIAAWFYRGPDIASSTDDERNALSARVNAALARLGSGWAIWVEAVRLPAASYPPPEASHFPDPVSRLVDAERRRQFEAEGQHFESEYALIVQFTPPLRRHSRIEDLIYDDDPEARQSPAARILEQFEKDLATLEDAIGDAVALQRMRGFTITDPTSREHLSDELVNFLHFALTGESVTLKLPDHGAYLDTVLGGVELWPGDTPRLGERYIACVAIEGFPSESYPQILDVLDRLTITYRWSTRFIGLDQHEVLDDLHRFRRKWKQRVRGFWSQLFKIQGGVIDEDALLMTRQAESAIADANSALVTFGYYTSVIVLMDEDRDVLLENARLVRREILRQGFAARIETINTMAAWLGTLPGHPLPNVRRTPIHTGNLSDLLPLSSVWIGAETHPNPMYPPGSPPLLYAATTGATPFRVSLHSGDVGHTLVFGPTGAGKSTLLAVVVLQALRYEGATICCFDKGRSLWAAARACGGRHYDIAAEDSPSLCPLGILESEADLAWAEDWIATCFELQEHRLPAPGERDAIHRAMLLLRDPGESRGNNRTLTHFIACVQDEGIRTALRYYSLEGAMGHLLDAEADGLAEAHLTVFEIEELMALKEQAAVPVLLYLFRRFERSLKGQPAYLVLDEAWLMLGHPVFRAKIREWLKGMRKLNCAVILATQSLSDASRSGILDVLIESCPTRIFLPNAEAEVTGTEDHPGPRDFYAALGLNDTEIAIVKSATPKRHYYLWSPEGRRLFDLGLGPIALSFAGISDKETIAHLDRLARREGGRWPFAWLEERGIGHDFAQREAAE
jgi:type IV secretion/conjugal transfer VirB4 family ATPase